MDTRHRKGALGLLLLIAPGLAAQEPDRALAVKAGPAAPVAQEARTALVIGNGAYKDAPLRNPAGDARAMADLLRRCGFQVTELEDADRPRMAQALREFGARIQGGGGVGLFYFAGHGMAVNGRNYLIPVGADITREDEVPFNSLDADAVLAKMDTARNRMNIVILDACRNNPFGRTFRSSQQGLAQMDAPAGSFVAFATAPGRTAADGAGDHGLYTQHLLATLGTPGLKLEDVFKRVRAQVMADSRGQQVPWENSSLTGDFFFVAGQGGEAVAAPPPAPLPAPRPSRAAELRRDGRFVAYDDGTVVDTATHLMWAARDNGSDIDWASARTFCAAFRGGGHDDWRLPTHDELAQLYDARHPRTAPCFAEGQVYVATDLIEITCFWLWTSDTRKATFGNTAGAFMFRSGQRGWLRPGEAMVRRALPVRAVR